MCYNPIIGRDPKTGFRRTFPCGECWQCKYEKLNSLLFRIEATARVTKFNYFLTLTYDDLHLPIKEGSPVVVKKHLTDFFNKLHLYLARLYPDNRSYSYYFKYLAISEYGGHTNRPHYHAIILSNYPIAASFIKNVWGNGFIYFGDVTEASIRYCCKDHLIPKQYRDHYPVNTFRLMSKGLGLEALNEDWPAWSNADVRTVNLRTNKGLYKIPVPQYYKQKRKRSSATYNKEVITDEGEVFYMAIEHEPSQDVDYCKFKLKFCDELVKQGMSNRSAAIMYERYCEMKDKQLLKKSKCTKL